MSNDVEFDIAIVERVARQVMALDAELDDIEQDITECFRDHPYAPAIESMPGFGPLLGAELVAAVNGDLANYGTPTGSRGSRDSHRFHTTPGGSAATSKGPGDTTGACCERATWPPTTASKPARPSPAQPGLPHVLRPQASRRQTP